MTNCRRIINPKGGVAVLVSYCMGCMSLYWILEVPSKPPPQLPWCQSRCVRSIRTCHDSEQPYHGRTFNASGFCAISLEASS